MQAGKRGERVLQEMKNARAYEDFRSDGCPGEESPNNSTHKRSKFKKIKHKKGMKMVVCTALVTLLSSNRPINRT